MHVQINLKNNFTENKTQKENCYINNNSSKKQTL